jgi:transcriptional regulator with XRE-family HTH domain
MDESAKPKIGERLRLFRETKKMSQVQMADALDGTTRGLQDNELGRSLPNSKVLIGLYGLGLNVNWLLSGEGPMLLADLHGSASHDLVNAERLGQAIAAVDKVSVAHGKTLSPDKRGKLAALVYQYFMLEKAEREATAYLSQLMELVSND